MVAIHEAQAENFCRHFIFRSGLFVANSHEKVLCFVDKSQQQVVSRNNEYAMCHLLRTM